MEFKTHIYDDAERAAHAIADLILERANTKKSESKFFNIAISGGSTPRLLFSIMGNEYEKRIPWESVRFFWVDERCVEPNHPESNFGMTYDALLQRTFIPGENIFRMKGEDIPENEAKRYEKILWEELPVKDGYPIFDFILLGMGEDGHTASIFPTTMELLDSELAVGVSAHPASGQKRITITGNTICKANQVVVFVTGENKAEIIKQIMYKELIAQQYPIAHVRTCKGVIDFYLDNKAASKL